MSEVKRFHLPNAIFNWICILIVLYAFGSMIFSKTTGGMGLGMGGSTAPPQLCPDSLSLDEASTNNFSASTKSYVDINPDPNSRTQLCFGSLVQIPKKWIVWDAQFVDRTAVADGCVAWFQYWGIDRTFGPYYANGSLALSNMPAKWRIATNCTIRYYQQG